MLIDIIAGARPNFVKIAPIIHALDRSDTKLAYRLIHTGQHYDARLSGDFFKQLKIPTPHRYLDVGSGSHAEQTGAIMVGYEKVLQSHCSDFCLVVGDVNSTMAAAIVARKHQVPVGHVEAGIRSNDWSMPEEINRVITDAVANWFFTTTAHASESLLRTGVAPESIFFVGNVMIDTLRENEHLFEAPMFFQRAKLAARDYILATLHRPGNVDELTSLAETLRKLSEASEDRVVVFPAHPRTKRSLDEIGTLPGNLLITEPQPYLQFGWLLKNCAAVVTDSGGVTEEATALGIPCLTLRDNTERPETITVGTNELVGTDPNRLAPLIGKIFRGEWKQGALPEKWDGKAATRIVQILEQIIGKEKH